MYNFQSLFWIVKCKTSLKQQAWLHNAQGNPGKKPRRLDKSESHKDNINSLKNLIIEDTLEKTDVLPCKKKKKQTNKQTKASELYLKKLLKIVNFLACNNLHGKIYPKMVVF